MAVYTPPSWLHLPYLNPRLRWVLRVSVRTLGCKQQELVLPFSSVVCNSVPGLPREHTGFGTDWAPVHFHHFRRHLPGSFLSHGLACLLSTHSTGEVAPKDSTRVSRPAECSRLLCSPLQTTIEFYNNQRERQVQRAKGAVIRVRAYVRALTMHSFIHAACAQVDSG